MMPTLWECWLIVLYIGKILAFPLLVMLMVYCYHLAKQKRPSVIGEPGGDYTAEILSHVEDGKVVVDVRYADAEYDGETPFQRELIDRGKTLAEGYCPRCGNHSVPPGMGEFTGCLSCGWRPGGTK